MTAPNGSAALAPAAKFGVQQTGINNLPHMTQDNVTALLKTLFGAGGGTTPPWGGTLEDIGSDIWHAFHGLEQVIAGIGGTIATDISDTILTLKGAALAAVKNFQHLVDAIANGLNLSAIGNTLVSDIEGSLKNLTKMVGTLGKVAGQAWNGLQHLAGQITTSVSAGAETAWEDLEHLGSAVGSAVGQIVSNAQSIIDGIVSGLTGLLGGGWSSSDAQSAAAAVAQQQADTAAAIAVLQQLNSGNAQSGNSGFVDFTNMADASSMGSSFSQWYSGSGSDTYGIVNGRVTVTPGTWDFGRKAYFTYTDKATLTDLQRVSVVLSTSPGKRTFGFGGSLHSYAYNYIRARVAETGTYSGIDCVMVIFDINSFDLGFVSGGIWTKWVTVNHAYRPGAIYSLDAGGTGGGRQYKVLVNGSSIYTHNEVGTLSNMGGGYRKTGGGAEWVIGSDGSGGHFDTTPGSLAAFYMADNTPPAILSSLGRSFRSSATTVNFASAGTEYSLPSGFFDTFDYATNDLEWDGSAGTWTVKRKGNYLINAMLCSTTSTMSGLALLYLNGAKVFLGADGSNASISYLTPLQPGDVLYLTYFPYVNNTKLRGDTNGAATVFQVARVTPDNLEDIAA